MHKIFAFGMLWLVVSGSAARAGPIDVNLGGATSFSVLAGSTVTNTGPTNLYGDLGVWPGTSVTGFPPGILTYGAVHDSDAVAQEAQLGLTAAWLFAKGETATRNLTGTDLGGLDLTAGVYNFSSSAALTGTLTLNAQNDPNAVFIFQIGSSLTTQAASAIRLINGASGAHIFWEVGSSATLGTNSLFDGSILANTSIALDTGADIACGRALARSGAVTLDSNNVSIGASACGSTVASVPEPRSALLMAPALLAMMLGATRLRRSNAAGAQA